MRGQKSHTVFDTYASPVPSLYLLAALSPIPIDRPQRQIIQYGCRLLWWYYPQQADVGSKERGARFEKVR